MTREPDEGLDEFHDFDALFALHQRAVYRTCLAILRNPDDAAEAAQEVFGKAIRLSLSVDEPGPWLQRVARNHCLDELRRRAVRWEILPRVVTDASDDPERRVLLRHALQAAFAVLSSREREALGRVAISDEPLSSVAKDLGVSYASAAQIVSRARRRAAAGAFPFIPALVLTAARVVAWRPRLRVPWTPLSDGARQVALVTTSAVLCATAMAGPPGHPAPGVQGAARPAILSVPAAPLAPEAARSHAGSSSAPQLARLLQVRRAAVQPAPTQPASAQPQWRAGAAGGQGATAACTTAQAQIAVGPGSAKAGVGSCAGD